MYQKRQYISTNRHFDNFDKIRAFYIDGNKLSPLQEKKRLQYEQAHQLRVAGYSKEQTIRILKKRKVIGSISDGYKICNNAEILFGNVAAANKEGMRVILTENFSNLYRKALNEGNIKEANRALENIAKINSLLTFEDPVNWNEIIIPIPIYSTNAKVLHMQALPEYQDAEVIAD